MDEINKSPELSPDNSVEAPEVKDYRIDFYQALAAVNLGKKISKIEWGNTEIYGHLVDERLKIHKVGGDFDWIISEADLVGEDYVVLPD